MADTVKNAALGWISMRHLQHMVARGDAAGLRMDELLAEAGLSRGSLADADGLVPLTAVETMLDALSLHYADPLLGLHLANNIQPPAFGAIGLVFQSCTTLADALDVVVRFNGLLSNIGRTSLAFGPGTVEVRWECTAGGENFRRHATEYVLGVFEVLASLLLPRGQEHFLQAVNFAHARSDAPAHMREYFAFFGCPVYFGRPHSSLVMPASALKLKLRHGDALLKEVLEQHAQNLLQRRQLPGSPADAVRRLIAAMLVDGMPTKDMVAEQLGMSARSLHRKLQEAGTSYRAVLDEVRLANAHRRLCEGNDSINVIAEALGFSSHQAFLRWFRQSTGQTPGEYRREKRQHHDD